MCVNGEFKYILITHMRVNRNKQAGTAEVIEQQGEASVGVGGLGCVFTTTYNKFQVELLHIKAFVRFKCFKLS